MTTNDRKLHLLWQQFEDACQKRACGLAIQSLAELDDVAGASNLPPDLHRKWSHKVAAVVIDGDMQAGIRDWASDYIGRVNAIVSTGDRLDSYDTLYIATAFDSLQSVQKLLRQKGLAHLIDFDAADSDAVRHIRR